MTSIPEKERRKALLREQRQRERLDAEARMPLTRERLKALFDHLDEGLSAGCDHSLRLTRQFLQSHSLPEDSIIPWLGKYGGHCDCEVLGNVEEAWPSE